MPQLCCELKRITMIGHVKILKILMALKYSYIIPKLEEKQNRITFPEKYSRYWIGKFLKIWVEKRLLNSPLEHRFMVCSFSWSIWKLANYDELFVNITLIICNIFTAKYSTYWILDECVLPCNIITIPKLLSAAQQMMYLFQPITL